MSWDEKNVYLYKVAWYNMNKQEIAPAPIEKKTAQITDNNVRLREQPNLQGKFLLYLKKNDPVEILNRTNEKMKIDNMDAVWYKVKTKEGTVGWVYGSFVKEDE